LGLSSLAGCPLPPSPSPAPAEGQRGHEFIFSCIKEGAGLQGNESLGKNTEPLNLNPSSLVIYAVVKVCY